MKEQILKSQWRKIRDRCWHFELDDSIDKEHLPDLSSAIAEVIMDDDKYDNVLKIVKDNDCHRKWLCLDVLTAGEYSACGKGCAHKVQLYFSPIGPLIIARLAALVAVGSDEGSGRFFLRPKIWALAERLWRWQEYFLTDV